MAPCPADLAEEVLAALEARFGLDPALFPTERLWLASDDRVFLGPAGRPEGVEPATGATLLCRRHGQVKPSTDALQAFGDHVTRNLVRVPAEAGRRFVAGEDLARDAVELVDATRGWVLVRDDAGRNLGCGLLRDDRVENVVPKGRRVELDG